MSQLFDEILRNLKPYVAGWIQEVQGQTPNSIAQHALGGIMHTGFLSDVQAPQFLKLDGSRPMVGALSINLPAPGAPFILSNNAKSQLVVGLRADELSKSVSAGSGLTGGGELTGNVTLTLGTPSSVSPNSTNIASGGTHSHALPTAAPVTNLGVSSTNAAGVADSAARSDHSHAIDSSYDPGSTSSLLKTSVEGHLYLRKAYIKYTTNVQTSLETDSTGSFTLLTQGSSGNLSLLPVGDIILGPGGKDVLPDIGYNINLGMLSKKYLSLHAAELWVETLVAQGTVATIGGRILVGPTTSLAADVLAGSTTIIVKHNQMIPNDIVYLEAGGKVEFMRINSGYTDLGDGTYQYTVVRNLDGSGANDWYAGDAVFNTGQAGNGFIDLYSVRGVKSAGQAGPTIVGNVRNTLTYNDWSEHWALGNLKGLYGYGATTYGFAAGKYADGASFLTADATNGIRILKRASGVNTVLAQWAMNGTITIGEVNKGHVSISAGAVKLKNSTTDVITLLSTASDGLIATFDGAIGISSTGSVRIGNASSHIKLTNTQILGQNAGNKIFDIATTGITIWDDHFPLRFKTSHPGFESWNGYIYATDGGQLTLNSGDARIALDMVGRLLFFGNSFSIDMEISDKIYTYKEMVLNNLVTVTGNVTATGTITGNQVRSNIAFNRNGTDGYIFVPITPTDLTDTTGTTWSGGVTRAVGTYNFDANGNGNNWPTSARAVLILFMGRWTDANNGYICSARPRGGSVNVAQIASTAANIRQLAQAVVPTNSNGDISLVVEGAQMEFCLCRIIGYFM